ncbi:Golgi-associated RAB2B interactor protein 3-like [Drosophila sulfurigaster albostrigata]|uniref:Golgi-associated RAB2B interactor protein 3-like n=1 Tax=Drosophila sulfurigaster albostrigata TaxID=89887 RepID=UPI002D21C582|nr:Golgi-associated RAB2B interactor protein 3-like [Drosophila sulfurigaster albostrigata]
MLKESEQANSQPVAELQEESVCSVSNTLGMPLTRPDEDQLLVINECKLEQSEYMLSSSQERATIPMYHIVGAMMDTRSSASVCSDTSEMSVSDDRLRGKRGRKPRSKAVSSPNLVGIDDASSAKRLAVSFIGGNADGAAANEVAAGAAAGTAAETAAGTASEIAAGTAAGAADGAAAGVADGVAAATAATAPATVAAIARLSAPACPAPAGSFVAASVVKEGSDAVLAQLAGVDQTVRSAVLRAGLAPEAAIAVLEATARLSELVSALVV